MKILVVVGKNYAGRVGAIEPMYLEFTDPLVDLGHKVEHFDHADTRAQLGSIGCGEMFLARAALGGFDLILYQTAGQDWMPREAIREAGRHAPIVGWNSDDDWQWDSYTSHLAPYFTFMVTTYPNVYDANRWTHRNLILSQWGCYDKFANFELQKDLNFTFAGNVYGQRNKECRFLRKHAKLRAYGPGSGLVNLGLPYVKGVWRIPSLYGRAVNFSELNTIWNRSKISYTPMGASVDPKLLQIKSRTFEMGLSGTLMLCQHSPHLERYYEPYKEFVPFENLRDCAEKAKYYLSNESERRRIAKAYYHRTKSEHLWQKRFEMLFKEIGVKD